jgi:nicotinate-nucleotide pyrophosphorylase (carboxylating)
MTDPMIQAKMDAAIRAALEEDMPFGDVSTMAVMPEPRPGRVQLIAKQDGVIAGLGVFARVFALIDPAVTVDALVSDGDEVKSGQHLATVQGDVRVLLEGERVALNYLQRMSGVATYTHRIVAALAAAGASTRLVCTRKTTPGLRLFEREAVRMGGGHLHRYGLSDAVMLKDNHIDAAGGIKPAVAAARATAPFTAKVEVECESLDMVREAVEAGADIIMLDNMDHAAMAEAIDLIDGRATTEASGNVTAENVTAYADLGVDIVSCGALTHSAGILDLSLKHLEVLA